MRYALHEVAGQFAITEIDEKMERLYATVYTQEGAVRILNFLNDEAREVGQEPIKSIMPHVFITDPALLGDCFLCGEKKAHTMHNSLYRGD